MLTGSLMVNIVGFIRAYGRDKENDKHARLLCGTAQT
jgi:hypothetical protein